MAERVTFLPIQEGEGDPSPENVRSIKPGLIIDGIGEIYGGYVDVEAGTVVETWAKTVADGVNVVANRGSYTSASLQSYGGAIVYLQPRGEGGLGNALCDTLPLDKTVVPTIHTQNLGQMYAVFYIFPYSDYETTPSAQEIQNATNEWLKQHPTTFVYKRRGGTNVTHPLTSTQLNDALRQLGYKAPNALETRRRIIQATPHKVIAAPSQLVTFETDMVASLKECKVYFSPVQEGEGDPSPDNVRPIKGWDGIKVFSTNRDLLCIKGRTYKQLSDKAGVQSVISPDYGAYYSVMANSYYTEAPQASSIDEDGNITFNPTTSSGYGPAFPVEIKPNTTYYFYGELVNSGITVVQYDADGKYINPRTVTDSLKSDANAATWLVIVRIIQKDTEATANNVVMSDEPIENPFADKRVVIPITFPTEVGAMYGGYADLVKGELVATHRLVVIDPETTFYMADRQDYSGKYYYVEDHASHHRCLYYAGQLQDSKITEKSNMFIIENPYGKSSSDLYSTWVYTASNNTTIRFAPPNSENIDSVDKMKNWISEHGNIEVYYPLANPILRSIIDPQIIKTLIGLNNVWSNSNGDIHLTFWNHKNLPEDRWDYVYYSDENGYIMPDTPITVQAGQTVLMTWRTRDTTAYTNRYVWRCIGARFDNASSDYAALLMNAAPTQATVRYHVTKSGKFLAGNYRTASESGVEGTAYIGDYIKVRID